jgi:ribosomal protein L7/L12
VIATSVLQAVPPLVLRHLGWPVTIAFYPLAASLIVLIQIRQIHRRGQTIREAISAGRAEERQQAEQRRQRAEQRERARQAAVALPWLHDRGLSIREVPGVLITPVPRVPGYPDRGYDIVLDSPGSREIEVINQVARLTRLSFKDAKDLVEGAPVPVLRVPDLAMAHAARAILESAGATVSVTDDQAGTYGHR